MIRSNQPDIVTVVASPPSDIKGPTENAFIDDALQVLTSKLAPTNRIIRAASIRDLDVQLSEILPPASSHRIRLQIVGHSLSGILSLGARWLPELTVAQTAFQYPFYVVDTTPASLGLLAKYVGKLSEVMLVGCNIGSSASYGYAVNGRTLTYTLAEVLQCLVRGADDIVGPDEFDAHGWYTPAAHSRGPKGWRWVESGPPVWVDPSAEPVPQHRAKTVISFEVQSITSTLLPVPTFTQPIDLDPPLHLVCREFDSPKLPSALTEVTVETDHGTAALLCGGRFLRLSDTYYVVEKHPDLSAVLTEHLWKQPSAAHKPAHAAHARTTRTRGSTHGR